MACLQKKGKWSEIIDDTPDIDINGIAYKGINRYDELEFECGETIPEEKFNAFKAIVSVYDLNVSRNGEDITDQIMKIAKYNAENS